MTCVRDLEFRPARQNVALIDENAAIRPPEATALALKIGDGHLKHEHAAAGLRIDGRDFEGCDAREYGIEEIVKLGDAIPLRRIV